MLFRSSPVELTNICVICDGDRILVENKIGHGICFPGGHVEPGESMEAAVIREMQEETGLTIASPRLRGIKDWMSADGSRFLVALYCTTDFTGTLKSSEEGRVFWVTRAEFAEMDVIWNMKDVLCICDFENDSLLAYQKTGCPLRDDPFLNLSSEKNNPNLLAVRKGFGLFLFVESYIAGRGQRFWHCNQVNSNWPVCFSQEY